MKNSKHDPPSKKMIKIEHNNKTFTVEMTCSKNNINIKLISLLFKIDEKSIKGLRDGYWNFIDKIGRAHV